MPTGAQARYRCGRKECGRWQHLRDAGGYRSFSHLVESVDPIVEAKLHQLVETDDASTDEVWREPTPGHTPGSQCFLVDGRLVSGDTLFIRACGRTDLPGGDASEMHRSLTQRLGRLPDDTILLPGHNYGGPQSTIGEAKRERIAWAIETMRLTRARGQLAGTLSGGNRQRLALGCSLLHTPPVLFLDEPTAGVDPAARRTFWEIIRALAADGTTIIVTTHYMDEAERFDRLAFLSRGHLTALGTPSEVKHAFGEGLSLEDIFVQLQEKNE